jgi:hypothetical protein
MRGSLLMRLLAPLLLLAGCATMPQSEWARQVGWVMPGEGAGPIEALPDTVQVGRTVTVMVVTRGSSSCTRADGVEVTREAGEVRVTPYDRVAPAGSPCTRDLAAFPRPADLRFDEPGRAVVVVIGRSSPANGEPVEVRRTITVRP